MMKIFATWLALLPLTPFLHGELVDHLKKAPGKGSNHSMKNIDFIYMINLDKRPEKFAQASAQLHAHGIFPYRFSAVNGWNLTLEAINDVGLKYQIGMTPLMATVYPLEAEGLISHEFMTDIGKTYFCHCMARGTIGCALSHISVLQDAWDSGYETIWVMEDDIEVVMSPWHFPDLIEKLDLLVGKDNWDVLFTDRDYRTGKDQHLKAYGAAKRPDMDCTQKARYQEQYTMNVQVSPDFSKVSARFGTHSMIIRRCGIKKLLEYSKAHAIFLPYDLDNYLVPGINRYATVCDIVTNMLGALSDNGSSTP